MEYFVRAPLHMNLQLRVCDFTALPIKNLLQPTCSLHARLPPAVHEIYRLLLLMLKDQAGLCGAQ